MNVLNIEYVGSEKLITFLDEQSGEEVVKTFSRWKTIILNTEYVGDKKLVTILDEKSMKETVMAFNTKSPVLLSRDPKLKLEVEAWQAPIFKGREEIILHQEFEDFKIMDAAGKHVYKEIYKDLYFMDRVQVGLVKIKLFFKKLIFGRLNIIKNIYKNGGPSIRSRRLSKKAAREWRKKHNG